MFNRPYRPEIQLNLSSWKIISLRIHVLIIILGIFYWLINWTYIPDIIRYNTSKGFQQLSKIYLLGYHFSAGQIQILLSFITYRASSHKSSRGMSASHNLEKAKKQYYLEKSRDFFLAIVMHLFFLMSIIGLTGDKVYKMHIWGFWWMPFPPAILLGWVYHQILWNRLSD
jgi:hypothetical protein